ncbi:MAG: hypothetical protein HY671_15255 [Chloroflexi bacterium]|nr:hypothetical protein [Chloroflexota bacterium]
MALRLAGEEFPVVQGLDDLGWLARARDLLPDGDAVRLLGSASQRWYILSVRDIQCTNSITSGGAIAPETNDNHDLGSLVQAWRYLYVRRLKNPGTGDGGAVFVDDALAVLSNVKLGGVPGNYSAILRPITNRNASRTMQAGEVVKLDTTNDQSVVDTAGAAELNPFVVVDGAVAGGDATVAVGGICVVNCDTVAVGRGDLLVSSATAMKATVDNTMADIRKILGVALTAKAGGAEGTVVALIR